MHERLSIIVPVLNEEARIPAQLARLVGLSGVDEIIVVDGGSVDRTPDLAAAAGCHLVTAPRGRGTQMNAGAVAASGDILLFLHADVTLPVDAPSLIRTALADPGVVAGAFRTRTIGEGRRTWATRWLGLADLRSRYTRLPYGDQALFVRRDAFQRVGGFPAQPLFEDLELSQRLWAVGRVQTLRAHVCVSGRRFLARPLYFAILMNVLPILYRLGVSPKALQRAYGDVR
jgi:rSAM/selenodomain-associated transferase 2